MKAIFVCVLLACIVAVVVSDCSYKGHRIKPGGKYVVIGECAVHTCGKDEKEGTITCPPAVAKPGCVEVKEDPSKPYPGCCKSYKCPK